MEKKIFLSRVVYADSSAGAEIVNNNRQTFMRDSGIELLKIVAILFIVISHSVQTLRTKNLFISYSGYVLDLTVATRDFQAFILTLFSYFGVWGNSLFFVCSAWFLLRSSEYNKRKWFFMLSEIWIVSVVILIITLIERHGDISWKIIIKSIFPTTFGNNWYLTCYLLFYPLHPYLNILILEMNQKQLFRSSSALFFVYCCLNFIKSNWFFPSPIILWVTIYFVMAYMQLYMKNFEDSLKSNIFLILGGLLGYIGLAVFTNYLGLHVEYFSGKVLRWSSNCNPFFIALSIGMFNLTRKLKFKSVIINYVSGLSLLIYIIHENIILRTYYRPVIWEYIHNRFGYGNVVLWALALAIFVFLFGLAVSAIYDKTARNFIRRISYNAYLAIREKYLKAEAAILEVQRQS